MIVCTRLSTWRRLWLLLAEFDFSRLSSLHKGLTSKKERESLSKKLKDDIDAAAAELAASAPNMKALEQYEAIREKEKQQVRGRAHAHFVLADTRQHAEGVLQLLRA